jgi:hypothetical protein
MTTKDSLNHFFRSRLFVGILIGVAVMFVLVCVFETGVAVGYHEATFSSHWGANYERNFGGSGMQGSMGLPDGHDPEAYGATGEIISVSGSTIVVQNSNRQEEKVVINSTTSIRNQENTITASALTDGTYVVVVGDPDDDGNIDASLIRVIPSPPAGEMPPAGPAASTTP